MVTMKRVKLVLFILVAIGMMGASLWYAFDTASRADLKDYVGDEVWYVPASRNMLHRLGFETHYVHNGYEGVNIIFSNDEAKKKYIRVVNKAIVMYKGNRSATIHYTKFPGIYAEIPKERFEGFRSYLRDNIPEDAYYIVTGFRYQDREGIHNYLNLEHPFLGKDFIMLSMLLLGDEPFYWRVPGLVLYGLLQILVLLTAYRITKSYLASLIALFFVAIDPTLQATAVTAMLDIYVGAFVALFTFLLVYGWRNWAGFGVGLASATKLSGAFGYPVLFLRLLADLKAKIEWKKIIRMIVILVLLSLTIVAYAEYLADYWGAKYFQLLALLTVLAVVEFLHSSREQVNHLLTFLTAALFLPLLGFLLPELPAIKVVGLNEWLRNFLGSFKWHLSYKGPNPWTSPFWEWFYNGNPFHFHFNPDIVANTNPTLLLFMVVAIFAIPYVWRKKNLAVVPFGIFWSTVGFFALHYALGGKTQFSFYATALVPEAAVTMGVVVYEIVKWEAFTDSLLDYLYWLGKKLRIRRFVEYVEEKRKKEEPELQPVSVPAIPLPPTVYVERRGLPKRVSLSKVRRERRPRPGGLPRKSPEEKEEEEPQPKNESSVS